VSWAVDLNADVGEERGDDEALLSIVTTASVAAARKEQLRLLRAAIAHPDHLP
jgi:lactam utilization protein B